jgi:hypothetical protein
MDKAQSQPSFDLRLYLDVSGAQQRVKSKQQASEEEQGVEKG